MERFNHARGQTFEVDGAALYYEVLGSDADPAIVLLHGGLGNLEDFNVIVPHFVGRVRLIAIDSRGHGGSTLGPLPLSYQRLQADVEAIVGQLGLERFSVIGFSDGGIVALRMAGRRTSKIDKLVVIGTPYLLGPDDPSRPLLAAVTAQKWRQKFPATYEAYQRQNPLPDFSALVEASVPMWLDTSPQGYPQQSVRDITCDLLVARGDDDHLVTRANSFELAELVPKAKMLSIPFAGHALHEAQPELLMATVNTFLQVLEVGRSGNNS